MKVVSVSRINCVTKDGKEISFGWNDSIGYYLQKWTMVGSDKVLTLDMDTKFHGLTRGDLIDFLHTNLIGEDLAKFSKEINKIAMDYPI